MTKRIINSPQLTAFAQHAYDNGDLQGAPFSSSVWLAAVAGDTMRARGLPRPERVAMGRGHRVNIAAGQGAARVHVYVAFAPTIRTLEVVDVRVTQIAETG